MPSGAVVESDRVNPLRFYGLANGAFYGSTDGGATFAALATGLPVPAQFKAVPGREGDVWVAGGTETTTYGLWHSTNGGATFARLANLEEADNIGFGQAAAGQTYPALYTSAQAGGVRGIYRSTNAGTSWTRINDAQHQYASTGGAITGDPRVFGRVYLSTNGRGIVYGDAGAAAAGLLALGGARDTVGRARRVRHQHDHDRAHGRVRLERGVQRDRAAVGRHGGVQPDVHDGHAVTLTLTASSTATLGGATVTVSGTGGGLTRTTPIALTVTAPALPGLLALGLARDAVGRARRVRARAGRDRARERVHVERRVQRDRAARGRDGRVQPDVRRRATASC